MTDDVVGAALTAKGYNGIADYAKYLLDFYNIKYKTNYTRLDQFNKGIIREMLSDVDPFYVLNDAYKKALGITWLPANQKRAKEEGKVISDNARPMMSDELDKIQLKEGCKPNLFLNFLMPALIIIAVTIGTYVCMGSAKTLEAFIAAVVYQFIVMLIQKMGTVNELVDTAVEGIKSVMSAMLILAMAYCLNSISSTLGTADYVISITESWMTPTILMTLTFVVSAFIAFFTGTSWGTYAIVTPICVQMALNISGGALTPVVYATIAAVMGGGCFGDHCSPLSDTTILSSLATGSDHIDHVKTQLPYALTAGVVACIGFLIIGVTCA